MFLATVAGIMQSMKMLPPKARGALATLHTKASWIGLLFGMAHGLRAALFAYFLRLFEQLPHPVPPF
jgi:hypothetical protein